MKIFMTGMTPTQVGSKHRLRDWFGFQHALPTALREAGHVVHQGECEPGDKRALDGYDLALVGLAPPMSMTANYWYSGMWCSALAVHRDLPQAWFLDDWQVGLLASSVASAQRVPERLANKVGSSKKWTERVWPSDGPGYRRTVAWMLDWMAGTSAAWPTTLWPQHGWGNQELLWEPLRGARSVDERPLDPSGMVPLHAEGGGWADADRERAWIVGALTGNDAWMRKFVEGDRAWRVRSFGKKPKGWDDLVTASPYVPEAELVGQWYARSWGTVVQPYRHEGSGWWRARTPYAVQAGALMLLSDADAAALGVAAKSAAWVEESPLAVLADWRDVQHEAVRSLSWDRTRFVAECDEAVRSACR